MEAFIDRERVAAWMRFLRKYVLLIIVLGLAGAGISYYYATVVREVRYVTEAKVLVERDTEKGNVAQQFTAQQLDVNSIETYKDIIGTLEIVEPALNNLKMKYESQFSDMRPYDIMKNLSLDHTGDSQVFKVKVVSNSLDKSAKMVNAVSSEFKRQIPKIMADSDVQIISKARPKGTPVGKTLKFLVACGAVSGLVSALLIGFILELFKFVRQS